MGSDEATERTEPMSNLQAWCNGYEVVAASSEEEARDVLRRGGDGGPSAGAYSEEDLDGDGWETLPDDKQILDEEGKPIGKTVGDEVKAKGRAGHLWSCEQ